MIKISPPQHAIAPLVQAFNQALGRLAHGYDRHNRFLTDAAHELRTPIAILRTRVELLKQEPQSVRLVQDIERLSHLAQQLLDHQLLDRPASQRQIINLAELASRVAADFAPLAIEAGYDLAFEPGTYEVWVKPGPLKSGIKDPEFRSKSIKILLNPSIVCNRNRGERVSA